jgi:hypothetical protein
MFPCFGRLNAIFIGFVYGLCLVPACFAQNVKLAWDPNHESDLAGYRVYAGTATRKYATNYFAGNITNYTVTNLTVGTKYFFAVTAVNKAELESDYSNEVNTTVTSGTTEIILQPTVNGMQYQVQGHGLAGKTYSFQASDDLSNWHAISSAIAGAQGQFSYTTNNFRGVRFRFYRAVQQ